VTRLYLTR